MAAVKNSVFTRVGHTVQTRLEEEGGNWNNNWNYYCRILQNCRNVKLRSQTTESSEGKRGTHPACDAGRDIVVQRDAEMKSDCQTPSEQTN